jgi:hypothetical protein
MMASAFTLAEIWVKLCLRVVQEDWLRFQHSQTLLLFSVGRTCTTSTPPGASRRPPKALLDNCIHLSLTTDGGKDTPEQAQ